MKICIISITLLCASILCAQGEETSSAGEFHEFKYDDIEEHFEKPWVFISAVVDAVELRGKVYINLYSKNDPKYGGIRWLNAPMGIIRKKLHDAKEAKKSLEVKMRCKFSPFSASYPTDPYRDPWACVKSVGDAHVEMIPLVTFKKNARLPEK